ncbi:MAG: RidA family protein [Aerococcus sp.]|nr:RidA family protein [Aerococcus sp.]
MAAFANYRKENGLIFISGQLPIEADGEISQASIKDQTTLILNHIVDAAKAEGVTKEDVIKTAVYTTDVDAVSEINAAYEEFFTNTKPTRSLFGVTGLVRGAKLEIDAVMKAPEA